MPTRIIGRAAFAGLGGAIACPFIATARETAKVPVIGVLWYAGSPDEEQPFSTRGSANSAMSRARNPAALLPKTRGAPRRLIKLTPARGVEVPFFGRPAPSTSFPALLAVAPDLDILAARTVGFTRFRFDWKVLHPVRNLAPRDENVRATTALIQRCFEEWVQ